METIGFIGLGTLGSGIAANIGKAGYPLVVHDVREEAAKPLVDQGARSASTPAEVAKLSDITFTSLPGPAEVEEVALGVEGIVAGIKPGAFYVDLSTNSPTLIRRIGAAFGRKDARVLDASLSGGKRGAIAGTLAVYIGGDEAGYEAIRPVLGSFGRQLTHAGALGSGAVVKLVHNMIGHVVAVGISEGLTLGTKAGVDPLVLWECLRRGGLGSLSALHLVVPEKILPGSFDTPGSMTLELSAKDVALATELGREFDVPLPMSNLAQQVAVRALNRGWGNRDVCTSHLLQEEAAGVEVRAPGIDPGKLARFVQYFEDPPAEGPEAD